MQFANRPKDSCNSSYLLPSKRYSTVISCCLVKRHNNVCQQANIQTSREVSCFLAAALICATNSSSRSIIIPVTSHFVCTEHCFSNGREKEPLACRRSQKALPSAASSLSNNACCHSENCKYWVGSFSCSPAFELTL